MTSRILILLICLPAFVLADHHAAQERDGEVRHLDAGGFEAWDAPNERWLGPDAFWASFAARERGRNWGSGSEFPPYAEVNEHDTFLLEHESGPCLMYFFHTRWRRANDVWRWDPVFNSYGGCAKVFD